MDCREREKNQRCGIAYHDLPEKCENCEFLQNCEFGDEKFEADYHEEVKKNDEH